MLLLSHAFSVRGFAISTDGCFYDYEIQQQMSPSLRNKKITRGIYILENIHARVMVLVHDTSSECAL